MGTYEVGMVLLSALLHAGWNVAAKRNSQPTAFLYLLTLTTLVFTVAVLPFLPGQVWTGQLLVLLLLSCSLHGASFVVLSRAYEAGDLSLVYPISRSTPAIVPIVAVLFLGEHVSGMGALGIALTLVGMWLTQTGGVVGWHQLRNPAALWAYLMLLITAAFSVVDKQAMALLSTAPWPSQVPRALAYYLLQTTGACLVLTPFALRRLGPGKLADAFRERPVTVTAAATATLASYVLILEALRTSPVSYVVAIRQCSVVFAVGFAMWALAERPTRMRLTGTVGTVAGVILIVLFA